MTQRLGSRPIPLFLERYLLVLHAERLFEDGQEGISHALLSFVSDGEPVGRIQDRSRPLDQGLARRCPDAARRSPIDDVVLLRKPKVSKVL